MLRPWDFEFVLLDDSDTSIHKQLTHTIITYISDGYLPAQSELPGTRALAEKLSISRKTVIRAYDELIESGWLYTEHKRGTFVSSLKPMQTRMSAARKPQAQRINKVAKTKPTELQWTYLDRFQADHSIVDFAIFSRASRQAMIRSSRKVTSSEIKDGSLIRHAVLSMLNIEYNMQVNVENLHILSNATSSLYFTTKSLLNDDEFVVLEENHHADTRKIFENLTQNIMTVKHDEHGINMDDLEKLCINYKVRVLYLTPNAQAITGTCLPLNNRQQLVSMADKYAFNIIEDESQSGVFINNAPAPLAKLDHQNHVIYLGCILEGISSLLNIAFIVANQTIIEAIARNTYFIKDTNAEIVELAIAKLLTSGDIKKQLKKSRAIIAQRKHHLTQLIASHLNPYVLLKETKFGRTVTVQLANHIDILKLKNGLNEAKISVDINTILHQAESHHYLNLYYYHLDEDQQTKVIASLKNILLTSI
jgi:GntR family transcriptional regulator/MocR family aminotransferase